MKKIYILLLIILPCLLQAQTIDQTDLPSAGTAFTVAHDTTHSAPIPAGGTGQSWNYGGLINHYVDTTGFNVAAGTPYAASFPSSNLSAYDMNSGAYSYYTNNTTGFYIDGFGTPSANLRYNPPLLYIPVPFSFGSTRNHTARAQIDTSLTDTSGTTNFRIVLRHETFFEADGSGDLIVPIGTYTNVLRVKITEIFYDSAYIDIGLGIYIPAPFGNTATQSVTYRYLTSGLQVNYVLGVDADSAGTTAISAEYLLASVNLSVPTTGDNIKMQAYPNPVQHSLNFDILNGNAVLTIYSNEGKEVGKMLDTNGQNINVESLNNGVYHYKIEQSGKVQSGTFVVQH